MTDASATVTTARSYDPFGVVRSNAQSVTAPTTPFGYTGEQTDPSTGSGQAGLIFLRARYYDPGTGRFTSRDTWDGVATMSQSMNRYAYGLNNPILNTDPNGHCGALCIALAGAGIIATATAVADLYAQLMKYHGNWACIDWGEVALAGGAGAVLGLALGFLGPEVVINLAFLGYDIYEGNSTGIALDLLGLALPMIPAVLKGEAAIDAVRAGGHLDDMGDAARFGGDHLGADTHAFAHTKHYSYDAPGIVYGQKTNYRCVAGNCIMIENNPFSLPNEELVHSIVKSEWGKGGDLSKAPIALHYGGNPFYKFSENIDVTDLRNALEGGPIIASIKSPSTNGSNHALVVDKIEDGLAFIRDSLPVGVGSSYSVDYLDFMKAFNGKMVGLSFKWP